MTACSKIANSKGTRPDPRFILLFLYPFIICLCLLPDFNKVRKVGALRHPTIVGRAPPSHRG